MANNEKRIAVVDSSPARRDLLTGMLMHEGLCVAEFEGAEAALKAMLAGTPPDLIVTALHMPGIEGWRFCRLLRSPGFRLLNRIPVLAVSSRLSGLESARVSTEAGISAFLEVPVDLPRFLGLVHVLLRGEQPEALPRVLIVGNDREAVNAFKEALVAAGYKADAAMTAKKALEMFAERPYAAAFIDDHLPDIQGCGLLQDLFSLRPGCALLFMTSDSRPEIALESMTSGAAACLYKPFSPKNLVDACTQALRENILSRVEDRLARRTRELQLQKDRYVYILEGTNAGTWEWNVQTGETVFNERWAQIIGRSLADISPTSIETWMKNTHPGDLQNSEAMLQKHFQGESDYYEAEFRMKHRDGHWVWVLDRGKVVSRTGDGKPLWMYGTHQDITDRKRAEQEVLKKNQDLKALNEALTATSKRMKEALEKLRAKEEQYAFIASNVLDIIAYTDRVGNYKYVSPSCRNVLGYSLEDFEAIAGYKINHPEDVSRVKGIFANAIKRKETHLRYETRLRHKEGHYIPSEVFGKIFYDSDGNYSGFLLIGRDITERRRSEEALRNLQKLESLGVLAGGIAHDFNNLLGGIFGYIDLARMEAKESKAQAYLEASLAILNRARALTGQLLTFSKGGVPVRSTEALAPLIREGIQFVLSGSNVSHRVETDKGLWPCDIDRNQIGQVIDNIVINAQQAMPMGGEIKVSARNIDLGSGDHALLGKGRYVRISIKDNGIGIPRELIPRIFDPFFTTKTKGHGLGLATCHSIINRHGGAIDVESEQGKGSIFHIYLPASEGRVERQAQSPTAESRGSGTIIVMDDEAFIRDTMEKMLKTMGYDSILVKDGAELLAYYEKLGGSGGQIAGIIMDLTVPGGMGGKDAVAGIRNRDTDVPVIVTSGYAADPVMAKPGAFGFTASLSKPFTLTELAAVLDRYVKGA